MINILTPKVLQKTVDNKIQGPPNSQQLRTASCKRTVCALKFHSPMPANRELGVLDPHEIFQKNNCPFFFKRFHLLLDERSDLEASYPLPLQMLATTLPTNLW